MAVSALVALIPQLPSGEDSAESFAEDLGSELDARPRSKSRSPRESSASKALPRGRTTRAGVAVAHSVFHHGLLGGPGGLCPQQDGAEVDFADLASLPSLPSC